MGAGKTDKLQKWENREKASRAHPTSLAIQNSCNRKATHTSRWEEWSGGIAERRLKLGNLKCKRAGAKANVFSIIQRNKK